METSEGLISIIIPIFNVESFLDDCIKSALNQTYRRIEFILVDDGSSDNCPRICDQYASTDSRVRVIHQKNRGLSSARNTGLSIARGEYVYFLDGDDTIAVDAIEKLYGLAKENDLCVVLFDADVIDELGNLKSEDRLYIRTGKYDLISDGEKIFSEMKKNGEYRSAVPLLFIRRSFLQDCQLTFWEGILYEDELFTFQLMMQCRRAGHLAVQLYHRRIRSGSITTITENENHFIGLKTVLERMVDYYIKNEHLQRNEEVKNHLLHIFNITFKRYKKMNVESRNKNIHTMKQIKDLMRKVNYLNSWKILIKCRYEIMFNIYEKLFLHVKSF